MGEPTDAATAQAIFERMVRAFSNGQTDDVHEYLAEDYYDHQGLDDLPLVGPDAFAALVQIARTGYTQLAITIDELNFEGDRVMARLTWSGTRADGSVETRATREAVRIAGDRAVEHWGSHE